MSVRRALLAVLVALAVAGPGPSAGPDPAPGAALAAPADENGTFRFLTQSLPDGSTNAEYVAQLVTANADGTVAFSVADGSDLTNGLTLDSASGYITGRPTVVEQQDVTFEAFDGTNTISLTVNMKFSAAGGGGNEGSTFTNVILAVGRVGQEYSHTVSAENGVGPYIYGAVNLPAGLTLNGLTGEIHGTPTAAGTFFVSLSVTDVGENNKVVTVQPLEVLPVGSDFRFVTRFLNNGEVDTPYFDTWSTEGGQGAVRYSASGLPPGLSVDATTGVVGGTPTQAGTFTVFLGATDGQDALTSNLTMIVAPSSADSMFWNPGGIPTAITGIAYTRQPPILVDVQNGTTVTYSAVGLPPGISYDANSGALSGTAVDVGEYPVTFQASDSTSGKTITTTYDFLVLPPTGGDASVIAVNLWIASERLVVGRPGRDLWLGRCIYNADRRAGAIFDPAEDGVVLSLGSRTISIPALAMTGTPKLYRYRSPRGERPAVSVNVSPSRQTVQWTSRSDTLTETLPSSSRLTVTVGRGYRMDQFVDRTGRFHAPSGFRRTAFVVSGGNLTAGAAGKGTANLSLLLGDPAFAYTAATSTLRIRILSGTTVLLDRDFTALGVSTSKFNPRTGITVTKLRTTRDTAETDRIVKCAYSTKTGRMTLRLAGLDLSSLTEPETHLGVELTVGDRIHWTGVTWFARPRQRYVTVR